jgi:hypothetical protein
MRMKRGMQFTERPGEITGARRPAASGSSFDSDFDDIPFGSCGIEDDAIWRHLSYGIKRALKEETN